MEGSSVKDRQHVRVYVRVRPLKPCEKKYKNAGVVECSGSRTVKVKDRSHAAKPKSFNFDHVFCQDSEQIQVYQCVLSPMIDEVLAGYNCTVFAYGQTGSGKTFTMVGERSTDPNISWDVDPLCGLIPRALSHLFDKLVNVQENYAVRVSYLELYNEELIDLLSKNDDVPKLKLYEDSARKGGVIVQGLEELEVKTKDEIYHILEKGSLKRQVAATLMNSQSSRSHTVFTITVHMKETLSTEEVVRTGRLNLVDLAGSENIGRSGSIDKRAREAGNINQSLLTLGRVITALTENAPHIPYRESKLTRLLQESLGGCTKTSIIATVSPAASNIEETLSTLEYAFRARKITNRPEINQKLTRKALITEYTEEIERLRRDLICNRKKMGVYLGYDDHRLMLAKLEQLQEEHMCKVSTIAALNDCMKATEMVFTRNCRADFLMKNLHRLLKHTSEYLLAHQQITRLFKLLQECKMNSQELCNKLSMKIERKSEKQQELSKCLTEVAAVCDEKKHLLKKHMETEKQLTDQTLHLQSVASESSAHIYKLHDKLSQVASVNSENVERREHFKNDALLKMKATEECLAGIVQKWMTMLGKLEAACSSHPEKRMQDYKCVEETALSSLTQLDETLCKYKSCNSKLVTKIGAEGQQIANSVHEAANSFSQRWQHYLECINVACKQVEDDVSALQKGSEAFRNIQRQEQLREIVEEYDVMQKCMKEYQEVELLEHEHIQKTLEGMLQHQVQFNADLESLDSHLRRMEESIATRVHQREELPSDNLTLDTLKNNISGMFAQQADAYKKLSGACQEHCDNVSSQVDTAVENCARHVASACQQLSTIESATLDVVECNKAAWKECATASIEGVSCLSVHLSASHEVCVQHEGTLDSVVRDAVSSCDSVLRRQEADVVEMVARVESLASQEDRVRECGHTVVQDVTLLGKAVQEFVASGLCKEQPTGKTPERKEFQYSREIATSSPDDRILERYRNSECYNCSDAEVQAESINEALSVYEEKENSNAECVSTGLRKNGSGSSKTSSKRILVPRN